MDTQPFLSLWRESRRGTVLETALVTLYCHGNAEDSLADRLDLSLAHSPGPKGKHEQPQPWSFCFFLFFSFLR